MSVKCNHGWCDYNVAGDCCELEPCSIHAHNPAVNESVSPSRTRGSLPASPGQIEAEAAAVQLAPVLCPPDPFLSDEPGCEPIECPSMDCELCEDREICEGSEV